MKEILHYFVSGEHGFCSHCSLWVECGGHELCLHGVMFSRWMSMDCRDEPTSRSAAVSDIGLRRLAQNRGFAIYFGTFLYICFSKT